MAALSVLDALQLLQLQPGATRKQIRAAYKRLALQLHPDKQQQRQQQSADATAAFARLSTAYSLLIQGYKAHGNHHEQQEPRLQPFETAYATGSLFSEQLLDEAVLMGTAPADIVTLQQLSTAAAQGQLAQHLAAYPPTPADEQLWKQAYTRMELRQQARQQAQQRQQQGAQSSGVGVGDLLSDLLLRPSGQMFVEDSDFESDSEECSVEAAARGTVLCMQQGHLQQQQQQQQQQQDHNGQLQQQQVGRQQASSQPKPKQQQQKQADVHQQQHGPQQQQHQHQQQHNPQQQQQQQQQLQPQQQQRPSFTEQQPSKRLRHGWGFYWMWIRRALLAKAVVSVLSSSLKAKMYEHRFPEPLRF